MWAKIIYTCLIHGTHMTEVTRHRVCIIYSLMNDEVNMNVGVVIFTAMKKARSHVMCRYGFMV